jgi:hypothetical protein
VRLHVHRAAYCGALSRDGAPPPTKCVLDKGVIVVQPAFTDRSRSACETRVCTNGQNRRPFTRSEVYLRVLSAPVLSSCRPNYC